jgi:hypothetical protein
MFRHRGSGERRDRGQASMGYIGAILAAAVAVSSVTVAVNQQGPLITHNFRCAVTKLVTVGKGTCAPLEGQPGDPGDPGDPGGAPGRPPKSCADVIYANSTKSGSTHSNSSEYSRQVRVNCIWYPVNPECVALAGIPGWEPGTVIPDDQKDALQKLVDCVTGGVGKPGPNPDDIACNKTTVMTGIVTRDPPKAQFGCTEWVVPIECKDAWEAWQKLPKDASPGDRQQAGIKLQSCMENFYAKNETVCVVKQDTTTNKFEITLLFFLKIEESNGVVIEQLGDGRWRVHMLDETKVGGDFKTPDFGNGAEFGLMASTGWGSDQTFEFGDKTSAESWVKWYADYAKTAASIKRSTNGPCPKGECYPNLWDTKHMKELMKTEPKRTKLSDATSRSTAVGVKGGYTPPGSGAGGSGEYKAEGNQDQDGDLEGALTNALGADFKGKVSLTATYNKDGSLAKVIMAVDNTAMVNLVKLNPEISAKLPGGFSVDASFLYQHDEGKATIRENVIDVGTHEYLRDSLTETMAGIFPQDKDGKFSKDAPKLDFDTGGIGDLTETVGTTRNLDYDIKIDEVSGGAGITFAGLPLISIKGGKVTEGRDLTGSSLDVIDVNGNKTKMDPSPKCHDKQIDPNAYSYDKGPPYADRPSYQYS